MSLLIPTYYTEIIRALRERVPVRDPAGVDRLLRLARPDLPFRKGTKSNFRL